MSKRIPIRKSGEALASVVKAGASSFSTTLKVVQVGSRAAFYKTAAQLMATLPAAVITPGDIGLKRNDQIQQYLGQEMPWDINLLWPIPENAEHDLQFLSDQETLSELFTDLEFTAIPGEPNVEIEDLIPAGIFQHTDFQELDEPLPIAWARLRVLMTLNSWSS